MENVNNTQSKYESSIVMAIHNIVIGNSYVGNNDDDRGKLYNNAVFGLSCTACGIDALLQYKGKNIPSETIHKCTQQALRDALTNLRQKTFISNSSKKKLPELLVSLLENPTIQTVVELFSIIFGNDFSELKVFDTMLDFKLFSLKLNPKMADTLIEYINSKKNDYSNEELEWFIDTIKSRKCFFKENIGVLDKFIDVAKVALKERSLHSA